LTPRATDDRVDIAFWEIGEGDPIVILNNLGISHAELEWTVPSIASFYTDLAKRYRVIRFDPRGHGLSGEPPGGSGAITPSGGQQGMTTGEMGLDISAVAAVLDLDAFTLMALSVQGPVAIEYAATHPQVTNLILCSSFFGGRYQLHCAMARYPESAPDRIARNRPFVQCLGAIRPA
jgi:pimeloyl-ACP methyl ester carboxylesterase